MSRKKKKEIFCDAYASRSPNDNFGTLFYSMVISEQYLDLNNESKQLYTLCRIQSRSETGRRCLAKYCMEQYGKTDYYNFDKYFVFPSSHLEVMGFKRQNAHRAFNNLIKHGFVEIEENNTHRHRPNVYKFSEKWKSL